MLQVQIKIAKAAPFAFPAAGIAAASLADSTQSADERGAHGILEENLLNSTQHLVGCSSRKFLQTLREPPRFDEYHTVVYTTMRDIGQ